MTREYWYSDSNLRPFFSYKKTQKITLKKIQYCKFCFIKKYFIDLLKNWQENIGILILIYDLPFPIKRQKNKNHIKKNTVLQILFHKKDFIDLLKNWQENFGILNLINDLSFPIKRAKKITLKKYKIANFVSYKKILLFS